MALILIISLLPLLVCWGSFLNALGYRLLHGVSIVSPRSYCPQCKHTLAWYDLIPLISWIMLRGKCRYCHKPISRLYPFIELFSACSLSLLLVFVLPEYLFGYFILFSALIVSVRTDLDEMLISQFVTLFLIPAGVLLSFLELLPITPYQSILGAIAGYGSLYVISWLFYCFTHKQGLGEGDMDLLSFIGAFTGLYGCWVTLLIASLLGTFLGIIYLTITKQNTQQTRIPFGPFLAIGAMSFVLFQPWILKSVLHLSVV